MFVCSWACPNTISFSSVQSVISDVSLIRSTTCSCPNSFPTQVPSFILIGQRVKRLIVLHKIQACVWVVLFIPVFKLVHSIHSLQPSEVNSVLAYCGSFKWPSKAFWNMYPVTAAHPHTDHVGLTSWPSSVTCYAGLHRLLLMCLFRESIIRFANMSRSEDKMFLCHLILTSDVLGTQLS